MPTVEILSLQPISAKDRARVEALGDVRLTNADGWFDGEIRETWPEATVRRYINPDATGQGTREERDALLAEAEIVIGGFPYPLDLRSRAPKMKWFHQRPAGASNLLLGDLWESDVTVTTSRGFGNTLAIAEYVVASILYFAKGLHRAAIDRAEKHLDHRPYKPLLLEGKTVCVVGAGGIGQDVGKLCAVLGMRVVGTRRHAQTSELPEGFSEIRAAGDLHALLAESDAVAICCQWTPETTGLIGEAAFAAMKPGAILVNVARGEIIDEDALVRALEGETIRGAALDVYIGEFDRDPDDRLWSNPRVLLTPHTSAGSDESRHRAMDVFCENLEAYLAGKPMKNVIDWSLGY